MRKKLPSAEVKITVRLPADLHARLVESAKEHDRSLNSEIVHLAKLSLSRQAKEKNA
jgi:predicted HicB family RNase H-like nuclease